MISKNHYNVISQYELFCSIKYETDTHPLFEETN